MCIVLVVELCDGWLCVFMLLVMWFEDYLDLLCVVEFVVLCFGLKIYIEGYVLLYDLCLNVICVVFDLGVIEVNIYFV